MKTYRQKIEELRLKSLRIIENGLNSEEPVTQFINAVQFLAYNLGSVLDETIPEEPDALDSEEITEKENKSI